MKKVIEDVNNRIETSLNHEKLPIGLLSGKMGLCIYFYRLARLENKNKYNKIAEKLLDEIFREVSSVSAIDIENGLAGIGLGISYLIKNNYVQGDENEILKDIDDEVFKQACFRKADADTTGLIGILYYISVRKQSLKKEQSILFNELIIQIVNTLHSKTESMLEDNSIRFNINTTLPLFFFVLSKIYPLNICNHKIKKMMEEIIPFVLSKYAYFDSKRFYLLWGIGKINKYIQDERLTGFCRLLTSQIDLNRLLDEFRNKNIFITTGLSGICLLTLTLEDDIKQYLEVDKFYLKAKEKIEKSLAWELSNDSDFLKKHIGLNGYCGVNIIADRISQ